MNATIDIKTPSGQSLEGFPQDIFPEINTLQAIIGEIDMYLCQLRVNPSLHQGDRIIIEVIE